MLNEDQDKTIKKNTFWLFLGQGIGRGLRTIIIIFSARLLGVADWGAFSYALGVATFLTVFTDIGMNSFLTRETSKNPELRRDYLSTIFYNKLGLIAIFSVGLVAVSYLIDASHIKTLLPLAALIIAFDSLRDLFTAISRSLEKMRIEGQNNIVTNAAIVIFGFGLLILSGPSAENLLLGYAIGTAVGLAHMLISLRSYIGGLFTHFQKSLSPSILKSAWPFGIFGLLGTIMINTDLIMIGWLRSVIEVGLYSAGQKIVQLLYIVPMLISTAFLPLFARLAGKNENFRPVFEHALTIIFLIALPLTACAIILAHPIIDLLYGASYVGGVTSFMILASTIFIVFPSIIISNAIFAHNKQKEFLLFAVGGVTGNIFFNFLFIPVWGIAGSALATLLTQILINIYAWRKIKKITHFTVLNHLKYITLATVIASGFCFGLNVGGVNIWLNVGLTIALYFATLFALKEPSLYKFLGLGLGKKGVITIE